MMTRCPRRAAGFTLIELIVVVAMLAIIAVIAVPSFRDSIARNRVEGVAGELITDLQYARSEAVTRNAQVGVFAASGCYTIFQVGSTAATGCADANLGTGAVPIKRVTISAANTSLAFTSNNAQTYIQFDPVRGMAVDAGGADWSGHIDVSTSVGGWQLRADVTNFGRAKACSPSGSFSGYPTC